MPNFYFYFISSLPTLHFQSKPVFGFKNFLARAMEFIPQEHFLILSRLPAVADYPQAGTWKLIGDWVSFDTALHNEVAKVRAGKKHIEADRYLRPDGYVSATLAQTAATICRQPSLNEQEKMLDRVRWEYLDELAVGHFFDLEYLIVYAYKLMILERWEKINSADKKALLEETLSNN